MFITDDARRVLEKRGVILFKDASANKGGVTSSSLEVLAALTMTDEEFDQHMRCPLKENGAIDLDRAPQFYKTYLHEDTARATNTHRTSLPLSLSVCLCALGVYAVMWSR